MQDFELENQLAQQRYQQALAAQQKAGQMPQGKMVGNQYVRPAITQYMAEMLRSFNAGNEKREATQELKDLRGKRQETETKDMSAFVSALRGTPAQASTTTPTQMPSFDEADAQSMQGIQGYGATTGAQAATPGDPMAAYSLAAASQSPTLRQVGMKGIAETSQRQDDLARQQQQLQVLKNAENPQAAIAAGVDPALVTKYYESKNLGRAEVGRTAEVEGPNGEKLIQQLDKFGSPIGQPMPGYMAPQTVNQGNKVTFAKPVAGKSFDVNMAPGEVARLNQSANQFQQSEARQANQFQQTQNAPVFSAEAGGFITRPTTAAPQGGVIKVEGLGNKPLNESQGNATMFGLRMAEADKLLKPLEDAGLKDTGKLRAGVSGTLGAIPLIGDSLRGGSDNVFNVLPSIMGGLNQEQQSTLNARTNFITAVLRKESGAAISPGEFITAEKLYFPAPGDGPEIIKQKQAARQQAITGIKAQAGPGAKNIEAGMPRTGGMPDMNAIEAEMKKRGL